MATQTKTPTAKAKTEQPKAPTNKKYSVNWTLKHDGKTYQQGDVISLDDKTAKSLLEIGVLSE